MRHFFFLFFFEIYYRGWEGYIIRPQQGGAGVFQKQLELLENAPQNVCCRKACLSNDKFISTMLFFGGSAIFSVSMFASTPLVSRKSWLENDRINDIAGRGGRGECWCYASMLSATVFCFFCIFACRENDSCVLSLDCSLATTPRREWRTVWLLPCRAIVNPLQ